MVSTGHSSEPLQGAHCPEQDGQTANQEARENVTRLGQGALRLMDDAASEWGREGEGLGRDWACPWEGQYKWKATGCRRRKWASASGCDQYKGHRLALLL